MQLVGGQFDLEMNFIIQEPDSIVCMVELLDQCEPTCQAEVWSIFTAILKKSVRNLQACTEVGLIQLVLDRITTTDSMIAGTGCDDRCLKITFTIKPKGEICLIKITSVTGLKAFLFCVYLFIDCTVAVNMIRK